MAVVSASCEGSEKSVGTRIRLIARGSIKFKLIIRGRAARNESRAGGRRLDAPPEDLAGRRMPKQIVSPRIRSFICLNAHPTGCAANIDAEIAVATAGAPGSGLRDALVVGASTGYGLSSLVSALFGYGARGTAVCLERPPQGDKTASAGWYNLAAVERRARERGREVSVVNGHAFSDAIKRETLG